MIQMIIQRQSENTSAAKKNSNCYN